MSAQPKDLLKRLQHMQRLIERACVERDLAYAEVAQWKQRYETEAHQRRIERAQLDDAIQQLELAQQSLPGAPLPLEPMSSPSEKADHNNAPQEKLQQELEQLRQALALEKENHQKTRASLITALGDALQRK